MFIDKTETIRDDIRENVTNLLPDLLENHEQLRKEFDKNEIDNEKRFQEMEETIKSVC
jgi:hypothetical protein